MVIAGTLAMIITMTFRIPYGAYCALYAFTISRDSSQIMGRTARTKIISYACGGSLWCAPTHLQSLQRAVEWKIFRGFTEYCWTSPVTIHPLLRVDKPRAERLGFNPI
jgi:hypothetical protein